MPFVRFESPEYWSTHIWDRFQAVEHGNPAIRRELVQQEDQTITAVQNLRNRGRLKVLDLACGTGRLAHRILSGIDAIDLTLLDLNPRALAEARASVSECGRVSTVCGDARNLRELNLPQFDVIIALDLLHHLADINSLFLAVYEHLRPDGVFIANALIYEKYAQWDRLKYGRVKSLWRAVRHNVTGCLYSPSPEWARRWIRRFGTARISPLSSSEIESALSALFKLQERRETYYFWFAATAEPAGDSRSPSRMP